MSYKLLQAAARMKGLKPHERCVLITLADRANSKSNTCYPSVARMVNDTGVSEREVHRALKKLRDAGLIKIISKTKHGTNMYRLFLGVPSDTDETNAGAMAAAAQPADAGCHVGSVKVPMGQTNNVIEPGTEQKKQDIHTSTKNPALAYAQVEKQHHSEAAQVGKSTKSLLKKAAKPVGDSKLVQAWKAAHQKAGLKCYVTAIDGKQLSLLVSGQNAISYQDAIETLIPRAVADWSVMTMFVAKKYGANCWGKKPAPKWPHAGFLLKFRGAALEFCKLSDLSRECAIALYVKPFMTVSEGPQSPPEFLPDAPY